MKDITGLVVGNIEVLGYAGKKKIGNYWRYFWKCKCLKCGNTFISRKDRLTNKSRKKAMCNKCWYDTVDMTDIYIKKLYIIYYAMMSRCYNSNREVYKYYGGRGIKVSKSWAEKKEGVKRFIADMKDSYIEHCNKYGVGEKYTSLDRIDVNKDYSKDNCRWATMKEQANNKQKSGKRKEKEKGI